MKTQTESPVAAQHTPGPWHHNPTCAYKQNGAWYCSIWNANGETIATPAAGTRDIAQANARLIAAAPELLAALEAATDYIAQRHPRGEQSLTVIQARAAIAKAKSQ